MRQQPKRQRSKQGIAAALAFLLFGVLLAACGNSPKAEVNLQTDELKQLVQNLSAGNKKAQSASISSSGLKLVDDKGKETEYVLPEQEFFVSIAPYLQQTHRCSIHNLAGCQGELQQQTFTVTVRDSSGKAILDRESLASQVNGFIDLWLPRDDTFHVTVEYNGKQAESDISTFEGDNTCITTMQLG
ncbi:CueP family metal-binding protein [Paenibacillus yonginensis]|uniref:CueP family metal-binding protein n=1 Tax=Paenibacillus yonginensis TaxID=1462996 RepID=UPI000A8867B5|nr:CueP family metal-binding protein [Paenibacillus yonginensis]